MSKHTNEDFSLVCAHMHMYVHVCMCICRPEANIRCLLYLSLPQFLRQDLLLNLETLISVSAVNLCPQGQLSPVTDAHCHPSFLHGNCGFELWSSCLYGRYFTHRVPSSGPLWLNTLVFCNTYVLHLVPPPAHTCSVEFLRIWNHILFIFILRQDLRFPRLPSDLPSSRDRT